VEVKICVYAIAKNEEGFIDRFAASARDADCIVVADTGSDDRTAQACRDNGVIVHDLHVAPWRFDVARNAALALVPRDVDICISLDIDEVMEPGWREEVDRCWMADTTRMRYLFDWGDGLSFRAEKIHARDGYRWHHPCHEALRPDGRIREVWAETDKLLVRHLPDPTKSRGQYLDLLRLSVEEDPHCPRNAFYYARELSFYGRWDEAIDACERYLTMPGAVWGDERSYALRVIGQCHEAKGDSFRAEAAYWRAAIEAHHTREPHVALAKLYYSHENWAACYASAHRALMIKDRRAVYTVDPKAWGALPHDLLAIASWRMGFREEALVHGKIAASFEPGDKRLQENLLWFRGEKE
jgi:glycosyltransferase involved in cell wall biosynthesis